MNFYFAPLEGITGHIYRNIHHAYFTGTDKYFSPFIVTNQSNRFKNKELKDVLPENNEGIPLVPQLLSNNSKDFLHACQKLRVLGYQEVNLNLGCPSRTVVSKYRGAGFLAKKSELKDFFEEVFAHADVEISVKTRLGMEDTQEFYELMEIFNEYPLKELIIHPRLQKDYYKNKPNLAVFKDALKICKNPVCYNGDIFTGRDYHVFKEQFPEVTTIMLGRGLLVDPGLIGFIKEGKKTEKESLRNFHDSVYEAYREEFFGDKNVLYKMKELWIYMGKLFPDSDKFLKNIKKAQHFPEYEYAVAELFGSRTLDFHTSVCF